RLFTRNDKSGAEQVVIINSKAANDYWPGVNPIGHRVRPPGMDAHGDLWLMIVGVVGDVREGGLDQEAGPQLYVHYLQRPERMQSGTIVVRTSRPTAITQAIRSVVAEVE